MNAIKALDHKWFRNWASSSRTPPQNLHRTGQERHIQNVFGNRSEQKIGHLGTAEADEPRQAGGGRVQQHSEEQDEPDVAHVVAGNLEIVLYDQGGPIERGHVCHPSSIIIVRERTCLNFKKFYKIM